MKNSVLIICLITSVCCLKDLPVIGQGASNGDVPAKLVDQTKGKISAIEKANLQIVTGEAPYLEKPSKKIKVVVYTSDSIVRKLSFFGFDESGTTSEKQNYYFDEAGKLIAHQTRFGNVPMLESFFDDRVIVNSKNGNTVNNTEHKNTDIAWYMLADAKFVVDYYLSGFAFKYKTFDVNKNTSPVLKAITQLSMRSEPNVNAPVIKNLAKGTELMYLEKSSNMDALNGKEKWSWYKVKTEQNQIGWIWGHPLVVKSI